MAKIVRYNLEDFKNITFDGFLITLPDETLQKISELALQVGSPTYIRTPVFNNKKSAITVSDLTYFPQQEFVPNSGVSNELNNYYSLVLFILLSLLALH
jgi:hypothetical protein